MSDRTIELSTKALLMLPSPPFRFYVDGKVHETTMLIADFLCPVIRDLHYSDSALNTYTVKTRDPEGCFPDLLGLAAGESVSIRQSNMRFFTLIAKEFCNNELWRLLQPASRTPFQELLGRAFLKPDVVFESAAHVQTLAQRFHELPQDLIDAFSPAQLYALLSHRSARIKSEDWACKLILELAKRRPECYQLFECICFKFVSHEVMLSVFAALSGGFEFVTLSVWQGVLAYLNMCIKTDSGDGLRTSELSDAPYHPDRPLEGIIAKLTRAVGKNVHAAGVIDITANHCYNNDGRYAACNVANLTDNSYFLSENLPNQSLTYDFKKAAFEMTHYTIRSRTDGCKRFFNLKSWVVEGSGDCKKWEVLDRHFDNADLDDKGAIHTFEIQQPRAFRFIRLRQTGLNHQDTHYLSLSAFELFGQILF